MQTRDMSSVFLAFGPDAALGDAITREDCTMHQTFDWIFFAIVGIPFILGFVELFRQGR